MSDARLSSRKATAGWGAFRRRLYQKQFSARLADKTVASRRKKAQLALLSTFWAGEVVRRRVAFRAVKAVYDVTRIRLVERVAFKLGVSLLRGNERLLQVRKLRLQIGIRELRIRYAFAQLDDQRLQFRLTNSFRAYQQFFDLPDGIEGVAERYAAIAGSLDEIVDRVEVEHPGAVLSVRPFDDGPKVASFQEPRQIGGHPQ